ncbi:MAG: glycosyltransferase [Cyanobacteria bacterium]|jgi:GT2 family glycosyltransferase|nr:glycosyltransferase [Cyanobacteria bacterium GSL.Bin1]
MHLAIIILNYRTPTLVIECLSALQNQVEADKHSVIVVDNASGDGSVTQIERAITTNNWRPWVQVLPSPINGGFSAGNNFGIEAVVADAYLLLNSDTVVQAGAIKALLNALRTHPEAGIISPRLEWSDGTPQISCFRYHSPVSELIASAATGPITKLLKFYDVPIPVSDEPIEPEWTSFACVLIRRAVIDQVGLMDEGYFMYFDDIDYCRRTRDAGWKILHWPEAHVVHLRGGSGSVKTDVASCKRPPTYLYQSRSRYFTKFYGSIGLLTANLFWLAGRSISLVRELVNHKQPHICEFAARDIWINWLESSKPSFISRRND